MRGVLFTLTREGSHAYGEQMTGRGHTWRRRAVGVIANLALLATAGGVVVYAVAARGFESHRAELNDGGIWVTNSQNGYYGRINKPIGQQDASTFATLGEELDLVQQDAVVVGVEATGRRLRPLDPATASAADEAGTSLPRYADVQLAGGSLAVLDTTSGTVKAQRVDPRLPAPQLDAVGTDAPPLATVETPASMAVTQGGSVLVASADDSLTRLSPDGTSYAATERELDEPVGDGVSVSAVGEVPVVLDGDTGTVVAQGMARAVVGDGAVLQAPGPAAAAVLVATPTSLLSVDLDTGKLTTVQEGLSGRPTPPVRLGACVYGAWSGGRGTVVTQCGEDPSQAAFLQGEANDLVFRVNRGQIVLNDRFSGRVWNIDTNQPRTLDDWPAFNQKDNDDSDDKDTKKSADGDRRPPKAEPDAFGARPGRTTTLYPLDNDSAPVGRVLAIRSVEPITRNGAKLTIGPDGQTVQLKLPPGTTAPTSFEYFIDDGREVSAHARVTVSTRRDSMNQPPALREGFKPKTWSVPAGGSLELPVLPDWRDLGDGDVLTVATASLDSEAPGAQARTTASGRVRFQAPPLPGKVTVAYTVTDGRSEPVTTDLTFDVQDVDRDRAVAAQAEPDITSVEAGRWVTLRPLANDLPGSDPNDLRAQLRLAGKIAAVGGAQVRTDLTDGAVSFRATNAKSYVLDYDVAYGTAPLAHGKIRVDVTPRESRKPVAMPDSLTLYGQSPGIADVLANDHDPAGGLLVVQGARALHPDLVDVAVIDGRWVRISARAGLLRGGPQVVRYSVSNGGEPVVGEITVTQRPAPDDNTPVTADDEVTVRAGASVAIPVLDNDYSPSGDALSLVSDVAGERSGELTVTAADSASRGTGVASVSGRMVRYVAPAKLTQPATYDVTYLAANTAGDVGPGHVTVSVVPETADNTAPEPPVLEARTVSGGTVVLKLPGAGVDPDGDPVSLVGLGSAPALGRVTKLGANTIEYQAYPDAKGTDEFDYTLTDSGGLQATGTVRVAVAPAGPPQPPLAVPDTITVEPGRVATVNPTANDFIGPGDRPAIELVDPPQGVGLEGPNGPVTIEAPGKADGRTVVVVYRLSNGLTSSQSTITLRTATPYNNPPMVFDAYGPSADAPEVRVDVLRSAYDPDGPAGQLRISDVYTQPGVQARVSGGRISVTRGALPLVLPFRVVDADGGAAVAQLYVPPRSGNLPFVKADALLKLAPGESTKIRIEDYVVSPDGAPLRLAAGQEVAGSPSGGVNAVPVGATSLSVSAAENYAGPGAVTFEVIAGVDQNDPKVPRAWLSIPVQVGQNRPILTCPTEVIEVPQGGEVELDVPSLCNVWTPDPKALADLDYTSTWRREVDGLDIADPEAMPVVVSAEGRARAGTEAILLVRAGGSEPGQLRVRVVKAAPPTLAPIRISDLRAGESRTVDLSAYLTPGVPRPAPTVVRVSPLAGRDVTVSPSGASSVRISAGAKARGEATFRVVMSDVSSDDPERQASNVLSVELLGVPDTPAAPVPGLSSLSEAVRLTWRPPAANGAPIDSYELRANGGPTRTCPSTTCDMTGLTNGKSYTFAVRAHNAIGWSDWSPSSRSAQPDEKPGPVSNIHTNKVGNHLLGIAWNPPAKQTSPVDRYRVTWQGRQVETRNTSIVANGLTNGKDYTFTVRAHNAQGWGPAASDGPFQSQGPIGRPKNVKVTDAGSGGTTTTLTLTWDPVPANGGAAVTYVVTHNGLQAPGCNRISAEQCVFPNVRYDGQTHDFRVQAVSGDDGFGPASNAVTWKAVAPPLPWGAWTVNPTGVDNQAMASFTVPDSRGGTSEVSILVNGSPAVTFPGTGAMTKRFLVNNNKDLFNIRLRVCNENDCTSTSDAQQVRTYGPLSRDGIQIDRTGTGTSVGWSIEVDPNGAPVQVDLAFSGSSRPDESYTVGPGDPQHSVPQTTLGFAVTERVTVTVSDSARGRGPVSKSDSATTPDPPDPVVTVDRGDKCNDNGGPNPCHPPGEGPDCTDDSCGFIKIKAENFFSDVTCTVTRPGVGVDTVGPIAEGAWHQTNLYFGAPGDTVKVRCDATNSSINKTTNFDWPN